MIKARFILDGDLITGFSVDGHSGFSEAGTDTVCAAVSSAAYMTANTVTDVLMLSPKISESDGHLSLEFTKDEAKRAEDILKGFFIHITELEKQYPDFIKTERGAI